ncbi:sensor histidine kinase [Rufibacter immobilis]|uniref:sensor histidine kinase n=1 Tax=Rufibacter immobilis TaxID=1348778 RepID=UPI0035ECD343
MQNIIQDSNAEALRLESLASYHILDTEREEAFNDLVNLAASIFKVPIAMISFMDAERQWVKANTGPEIKELARELSFCNPTLESENIHEIPDTRLSFRFANNPVVTPENGIRFYAGAPLITKTGYRIGTLCILDMHPRSLTPEERVMLRTLADQVMPRLDLYQRERELEKKTQSTFAYAKKLDDYRAELEQIAYAVAHELKSPLRAINNLAEWVSEELDDCASSEIREKLSLMRDRVLRLENLFNGLLDLAKVSRGIAGPQEVNTYKMVSQLVASLQKKHPFTASVSYMLPTIMAEKTALETVFLHLLKNAVEHNPQEDLKIEVGYELTPDKMHQFYLQDNGIGIAPAYHEHIFGIFKTIHNQDRQNNTGIGLTLVRKIVREREARVWVESTENTGTRFYFTWPV